MPESRVPSSSDPPGASDAGLGLSGAVRAVMPGERVVAAARLVGGMHGNAMQMGRAFVERASGHGIDISLLWGMFPSPGIVSQSALVVPQVGRTAMLFLSGPGPRRACGESVQQRVDRAAVLRTAISEAGTRLGDEVHLFQALPSPDEGWAIEAFGGAGMMRLGDLAYLRRPFAMRGDGVAAEWPAGVEMRLLRDLSEGGGDLALLRAALERTYIGTLDCPGLCDLRATEDVIASHKSAGTFAKAQWWLIEADGSPEGCVLLSPSFETRSLELVYMGLGPALRGRGLAIASLRFAIQHAQRLGLDEISCAVDLINEPARAVYARLGFTEFARRVAFVRPSAFGPRARS